MAKDYIADDSLEDMLREAWLNDPDRDYHSAIWDVCGEILCAMTVQGVTQMELAQRTGLKQPYISRILSNPRSMSLRTAFRLCRALDLELTVKAQSAAAPQRKPEPDRRRKVSRASSQQPGRKSVSAHSA